MAFVSELLTEANTGPVALAGCSWRAHLS